MVPAKRKNAFRIDNRVASYSLDNAQLEVGSFSNSRGDFGKGINLIFPTTPPTPFGPRGTYSYILSPSEASQLAEFLDQVLAATFPAKFNFTKDVSGRWFSDGNCTWSITSFVDDWHGGGGYKGSIDSSFTCTITKSAIQEFRKCVIEFFGIAI